jgi:hypothetical protein
MDGREGRWKEGWMNSWTDGRIDGWKDGWMRGWMEGWVDGRMYLLNTTLIQNVLVQIDKMYIQVYNL